jgi:hypothetical protein
MIITEKKNRILGETRISLSISLITLPEAVSIFLKWKLSPYVSNPFEKIIHG